MLHAFAHPLSAIGGVLYGGILSDIGLLGALAAMFRHLNCHEPGCWKRGALTHQASGTKWCHDHAPEDLRNAHPKPHHHWKKEETHVQ